METKVKMSVNLQTKTLIKNWVEERQVAHLDVDNKQEGGTLSTKLHRQGHKGILTTNDAVESGQSTVQSTYISPQGPQVRMVGSRREGLQRKLLNMVKSEVEEEFTPNPPKPDYTSVTKKDFTGEFEPQEIQPTQNHDLYQEQPASYWKQNVDSKIMGLTQVCATDAPFRKNALFSTPIEHRMHDEF